MILLLSHQRDLEQTHTHTQFIIIIFMINYVHVITDCVNSAKKRENTPEAAIETLLVAVKR